MEPYHLRRWRKRESPDAILVFTCARPGRSFGPNGMVSDDIVKRWLKGLPKHRPLTILSLLGMKPDGTDEHSFYSFGSAEGFSDWVDRHSGSDVKILSFPTVDFEEVERSLADRVRIALDENLDEGAAVVILDSGGEQRTGAVCKMIGLTEDPRS